ncbi:cysteine protease StiP family protein [Rossellomorea vietnamensis]|uniref:cysteine protease StiP family protein n=1 Tax=Rossellomorea vietnamensis TaxID=218284 RepID=UPI001E2964D4|nr:cysteine protease StiP family protein [Rossellomorea vietnamensis]MCC5804360.1 cysteine protease StiP family protein [Rossellomorea vietnamensis]
MVKTMDSLGSYAKEDVTFLLKDLSGADIEKSTLERERAIQNGVHYSEMLPVEYQPSEEYIKLFHDSLEKAKKDIALYVALAAEQIVHSRGLDIVLCSLARAGTPIGVLMKRYIGYKYGVTVPHYSISIIRGRGIDENALSFILDQHPGEKVVFVDGWTGKGAITKELTGSISRFNEKHGTDLSHDLAVLADPGHCSNLYGTREDFLIPSACLNSTVSGLMSRTVLNDSLIGPDDFHGAKYYKELLPDDLSSFYVDSISSEFKGIASSVESELAELREHHTDMNWAGLNSVRRIQEEFQIADINHIKPGVGETTRVLLRRVPWKILINTEKEHYLEHILMLARDRGVPVEEYNDMSYSCCGLIKQMDKKA